MENIVHRQYKEVTKKQQSLIGLMEELGEKNEEIQELKSIIKSMEAKIQLKENGAQFFLDEDN